MMSEGPNSASGQLQSYVDRLERLGADKKQVSLDISEVMAEAKASGFVPSGLRHVLRLRAMKPHDRQEAEAVRDTYLHALGMEMESPLHRQVGLISVDRTSRESVIEALKAFVPENGSIIVEAGGRPLRLTRNKDGTVSESEAVEAPPAAAVAPRGAPSAAPGAGRAPPPDVDADGAEALGREAFKANEAIIANPFPFGDPRRSRWDGGWRAESGTDGMGPDRKP